MARSIACGHCGDTHSSVAEVRACSAGSTDAEAAGQLISREDQAGPTGEAGPLNRTVEQLVGPAALGRSVLYRAGEAVPSPWAKATVITAGVDADQDTIETLHRAWREREAVAIAWTGQRPEPDQRLDVRFESLSPRTEIPGERLRFAITANAVDLLGDEPDFEPIRLAGGAGAQAGGSADVTLPDGDDYWVDGGPLDPLVGADLGGYRVIPRPHLVAELLQPQHPDRPEPRAELAADQLLAVGHRGGPARIIAPAGSGKTRVLTERTRHLIADRQIHPRAVSLVAYNRRARQEMAERLGDVGGLDIRTLNSLALAIATGSGPFARPGSDHRLTTITEMDTRRLIDRVVPGRRRRQLTDPLEPWIDALSACRLGLRDPAEVEAAYGADIAGFSNVLEAYRDELRRRGELDFDEQILLAIETLLTDPGARAIARRATPILLVDEFQDLTPAHLLLVRLLAGPAAEVFAVGDDDQTIYGYSGASPTWLVDFSSFFPGAEDHPLTVNYRCPPEVVESAKKLLSHNQHRVPKTIVPAERPVATDPAEGGAAPPISAVHLNGTSDPQQRLVEHVKGLLETGVRPNQIAVLARVNAALLPPAVYLAEAGIAVARPPGVDVSTFDRSGVGAALSWLRLASAPSQRLAADDLRQALRRPPRSLHPRVADWLCEQRSVKDVLALAGRLTKEREAQTVNEFGADLDRLRTQAEGGATAAELLDVIYHEIGLLGAASQLDRSQRTARRAAHSDDLGALQSVALIHPDPATLEGWLRERVESIPRLNEAEGTETITLATIHTTKGLEWPHVIVHDVRGDLHPHRLATDIEEERRIFHVAITRCSQSLLVNAVPRQSGPASPFVEQLSTARPSDQAWPAERTSESAAPAGTAAAGASKPARPERSEPASPSEAARREALTAWRSSRCKADNVPAYIVVGNATLDAIAAAAPTTLVALGQIKGIGPAKLERYGSDVLGVLASVE